MNMSDYDVGKDIGHIYERLNNIEQNLINLLSLDSPTVDDYSHRLSYPLKCAKVTDAMKNSNLCKAIEESTYDVEMLVTVDGVPSLVKSTLTRSEFDDYISKNPGKAFSEYIVSVTPSYKDFL